MSSQLSIMSLVQQSTSGLAATASSLPLSTKVSDVLQSVNSVVSALPLDKLSVSQAAQGVLNQLPLSLTVSQMETDRAARGLMVGDVLIQGVQVEETTESLNTAEHPKENRRNISDHAWRSVTRITVRGYLAGNTTRPGDPTLHDDAHKRALQKLRYYRDQAKLVNVVIDSPFGVFRNCLVKELRWQRSFPWVNAYELNLTLEQQQFVFDAPMPSMLPDSMTGFSMEGLTKDLGMQFPQVFGLPPSSPSNDGGLGGLLDSLANLAGDKLKDFALSAADNLIKQLPGGALISGLLRGQLGADSLVDSAIGLIPGGSMVSTALDFLGGKAAIKQMASAALKGVGLEKIASQFIGNVAKNIAKEVPLVKDIAGLIGGIVK